MPLRAPLDHRPDSARPLIFLSRLNLYKALRPSPLFPVKFLDAGGKISPLVRGTFSDGPVLRLAA